MMEEIHSRNEDSSRADPIFKTITRLLAEQLGLQASETELQHSTRSDLILKVPSGVSLEGTILDFFRKTNVVEFKSQGDPLTLRKYLKNELRVTLQLLLDEADDFENILNVIVSARYPQTFLKQARHPRIKFKPVQGKPWLLRGEVGFQDVAIVVCINLPLEERYYEWLAFAPSDSAKWREYVELLIKEQKVTLLETAKSMHPKEFKMLTQENYEKLLAQLPEQKLSSEEQAEIARLDAKTLAVKQEIIQRLSELDPVSRKKFIQTLAPYMQQELLELLIEQTKEEQS